MVSEATSPSSGISPLIGDVTTAKIRYWSPRSGVVHASGAIRLRIFAASGLVAGLVVSVKFNYRRPWGIKIASFQVTLLPT